MTAAQAYACRQGTSTLLERSEISGTPLRSKVLHWLSGVYISTAPGRVRQPELSMCALLTVGPKMPDSPAQAIERVTVGVVRASWCVGVCLTALTPSRTSSRAFKRKQSTGTRSAFRSHLGSRLPSLTIADVQMIDALRLIDVLQRLMNRDLLAGGSCHWQCHRQRRQESHDVVQPHKQRVTFVSACHTHTCLVQDTSLRFGLSFVVTHNSLIHSTDEVTGLQIRLRLLENPKTSYDKLQMRTISLPPALSSSVPMSTRDWWYMHALEPCGPIEAVWHAHRSQ